MCLACRRVRVSGDGQECPECHDTGTPADADVVVTVTITTQ